MPMDIRDFFAKGAAAKKKAKSKSSNANDSNSSSEKVNSERKSSSGSRRGNSKEISKKVAPSSKLLEGTHKEETSVHHKKKSTSNKKTKNRVIIDSDSDSDATTGVDDVVEVKDDSSNDESLKKKKTTAYSRNKPDTKSQNLKEVSASDFFGFSSKQESPAKPSKQSKSYNLDEDDIEEEKDRPDEKEIVSKERRSPDVSKRPPSKPQRKASPVKRQKLEDHHDDGIRNDNGKDDDEDFVDLADDCDDDDEDFGDETTKKASTRSRGKRTPSPAKSKSKIKDETPPSNKKRKTQAAGSVKKKTSPKKEKEAPLEPTLSLAKFNVDDAIPEVLAGLTFVFTGVDEKGFSKNDGEDFVKTLGGRVTSAVSSKTTYLVVLGNLEDGRDFKEGKKYRTAEELGTHIVMGEKQLYGLAKLYNDKGVARLPAGKENNENSLSAVKASQVPSPKESAANPYSLKANPYAKKGPVVNPYAKKGSVVNPYAKKDPTANPYVRSNPSMKSTNGSNSAVQAAPRTFDPNALWVDKHAPASSRDILGNKDAVTKLRTWLNKWEHNFNNTNAIGKAYSNPKGPWKAALLSGPPGIGKTTTATLVAKEAGRDLMEFNASDVRSKKFMHEHLGDITGSRSVDGYFHQKSSSGKQATPKYNKRCIIMDEVDGMGGGDRGGLAELIQMIKNSQVPIICICNDRQSQKMKSLVPYCMDLRFRRPVKSQIAAAAINIADREGLHVESNAAEAIAESCGNDIRQVLNCLQMWASDNRDKESNRMTYKGLKERQSSINKDEMLRVSLFDASRLILEGRKGLANATPEAERASFFKRNDAFFVDYSFTGLIVQQNYLKLMNQKALEIKRSGDDNAMLEFSDRVHSAAQSMSDYAMVEHAIRGGSDMNWGLLPFSGVMAVKTGFHAAGPTGSMFPGFPEFTTWLGRNSSKGKKQRIAQELNFHINYRVSGGSQEVRLSYLPYLRQRFLGLLRDPEIDDRNSVAITLMDEYGLDRDDVFENLDEFKMDPKEKMISDIDSKAKAAFTRQYNDGAHKSQALVEEQGAPKKTKKKGGGGNVDAEDPDAINDDVASEDEEDSDDDMQKLAAAFKRKGRKSAAKGKAANGKRKK